MVVNNKTPVHSVKEFVDYAKARPGKLTFGSTGTAALDYLAVELFMKATGTSMVHVPYRGGPAALNDLMGGSIDLLIEVFPVVMEQARSGLIRPLAVSSPYRLPSLPSVPTFKEAGVPGVELTGWLGIYGPPRMPEDVRATLGSAIAGNRQAARHAGKIPRHRLRADRARPEGIFRAPRRRGEAVGRVHDRDRLAEIGCKELSGRMRTGRCWRAEVELAGRLRYRCNRSLTSAKPHSARLDHTAALK